MPTRRKAASKGTTSAMVKHPRSKLGGKVAEIGNGLRTFSMHALDKKSAPMFAKLRQERASYPAFAFVGSAAISQLDPETVAKRYLSQALESPAVPTFTAPKLGAITTEFKSLGSETVPLTGTTTVKFRQTFDRIPIYGSLVTVELDDDNNLLSLNSSMGNPKGVSPVAKIAPAQAVESVKKYPGFQKELANIVPRLMYYFDKDASKWRLVFILEDVPVSLEERKGVTKPAPQYMDYIVDAHSGDVVAQLPRTPSMAATEEPAIDGQKKSRQIKVETNGGNKILQDTSVNVQTFDFRFTDPQVGENRLPGMAIHNPPTPWAPAAVSAQANAVAVADFLRNVLRRNNIDNKGGAMNSSINCVVAAESPGNNQWFNAFWNGTQMVYGQRRDDAGDLMSLSVDLDVVAHEMFHGVTDSTARLEYAEQSGALNEFYSDIFGIIIANFGNADTRTWNWNVGEGLSPDGKPFRDMQDPTRFGQPAHMRDFVVSSNTPEGDWGGVHTNSGIHNKAAYNILTSVDRTGQLLFRPEEVAALLYLALTQQLSQTSQFNDSLRGVLTSARTLFRTLPPNQLTEKLNAIKRGFSAVGISA